MHVRPLLSPSAWRPLQQCPLLPRQRWTHSAGEILFETLFTLSICADAFTAVSSFARDGHTVQVRPCSLSPPAWLSLPPCAVTSRQRCVHSYKYDLDFSHCLYGFFCKACFGKTMITAAKTMVTAGEVMMTASKIMITIGKTLVMQARPWSLQINP